MRFFVWWLAYRQVFSRQTKAGIKFMTIASMLGIAIGIAALVITLSVMGGFESELRTKIFFGMPHLEIMNHQPAVGISLKTHPPAKIAAAIGEHAELAAYIKADVIAKLAGNYAAVTVLGLDPRKPHDIFGIRRSLTGAKSLESQLIKYRGEVYPAVIGDELALSLGLMVGDRFALMAPNSNLAGFLAGEKLSQEFEIVDIFNTQKDDLDGQYVVTHLSAARKYMDDYDFSLDQDEFVTGIAVVFAHPDDVDQVDLNSPYLSQFSRLSWKEVNKSLLIALLLEKLAMSIVLSLIVVVAVFSLSGTVMMTVYHRKTQIALLRGLGMSSSQVAKMFVAHGTLIGVGGIVSGLMIGLGGCWMILKVGVVALPQGLYTLQKLPVKFLILEYILIGLGALVLTVLASVYPAYISSRQDPGQGLRY